MIFADPPYNVAINGNASGKGGQSTLTSRWPREKCPWPSSRGIHLAAFCALACEQHAVDGSLHFICMDWRGMGQLLNATRPIYDQQLNLCVWNKPRAGLGSFYRSKHELIFVFKKGGAPPQQRRAGPQRSEQMQRVGPPKRLDRFAEIQACAASDRPNRSRSCRCDPRLHQRARHRVSTDGGAGTTLIAAERTRRRARLIELDPGYVDVTIRRWQHLTGKVAVHAKSGEPFASTGTATLKQTHG